mgnify:CR=1 FL=1
MAKKVMKLSYRIFKAVGKSIGICTLGLKDGYKEIIK